ncbi:hypothetical protein [Winogradskyella pulchriflava]|uniref:Uncharacterized protein n=1 Tax=Winogradskyella pulchriflava TaxID=1110688 RepID=A0ABV6Q9J0_9FLAO
MKIVFLISSVGHGKGGHFHDLNTIANELGINNDVFIINLGYRKSDVFDSRNYNTFFVKFNGYNFFKALGSIKSLTKKINPDAINAFDLESFAFSRLISLKFNQQNYLTKCGGPNPKRYFPQADNLVLVSDENLDYFRQRDRYKNTEVILIPDRVAKVNLDYTRINDFKAKHNLTKHTILRINRIGKHYHKTMIQSVNLLKWLANKGLDVKLVILGTIQNEEILNSVLEHIRLNNLENKVIVETSDVFTHNASELVDIGDAIIGTGRNFMEASSLNKLVFVPYNEGEYPLLVNNSNFNEILASNFSPRTKVKDFNSEINLNNIFQAFTDQDSQNSIKWFEQYFDVANGALKYEKLYQNNFNKKPVKLIDTLTNILYAIKTFVLK